MISFPLGWRPFLAPHTARQPMQSSLSAMLWECPTSRPSGSIKCQTTGTHTLSACTPTSPPSVEPSSTWCTSSSGEQSLWCMTTAQVQVQLVSVFIFQWRFCFACVWQCLQPVHLKMSRKTKRYQVNYKKRQCCSEFAECFVNCQVNSEINSLLFCLSPAGAAHVSLPEE